MNFENEVFGLARFGLTRVYCITLESKSLGSFWNFSIFCLLYIHINNNKYLHMTNSKLRNSDSTYSICFSQVLLKLFTILINTTNIEI